jgi:hypothetical protein
VSSGAAVRQSVVPDTAGSPRAVIVLIVGDRALPCGTIGRRIRCDLDLVAALARMQLTAQRRGYAIRLERVEPSLRELVELLGLGPRFGLLPPDAGRSPDPQASKRSGSPNAVNSSG